MENLSPLFARQPIFDRQLNTVAYELLFRGGQTNQATIVDGDQATSHVLLYAFGQNRVEDIIGNVPAYINFTPQLLVYPPPLPPHRLVIEILETVKPDKWVFEGIKTLKNLGYKIALDDFFINKDTKALLAYADIIKIDVLSLSSDKLKSYVNYLKPLGFTLLAEKIETQECLKECVDLGFELFQGYFLAKPQIIEGRKITESKQALLRLLATLMSSSAEVSEIVESLSTDPRLSYRILKIVNSTACHIPCEIHSLNQAVTMLGLTQIRNWAAFLLMTGEDNDKPRELSLLSMMRAKLCEQIGSQIGGKPLGESCFTAGLLSTFDAFLDIPQPELVKQLGLSEQMQTAILDHQGEIGEVLSFAKQLEKASWDEVENSAIIRRYKLTEEQINVCFCEASSWTMQAFDVFN